MNADGNALLDTLRGLKPTEGVWETFRDDPYGELEAYMITGVRANTGGNVYKDMLTAWAGLVYEQKDDLTLITLAPALRDLALRQADRLAAIERRNAERRNAERRSTSASPWFLTTGDPIPDDQLDAYYEGLDDGLYNTHERHDAELEALRARIVELEAERHAEMVNALKAELAEARKRITSLEAQLKHAVSELTESDEHMGRVHRKLDRVYQIVKQAMKDHEDRS